MDFIVSRSNLRDCAFRPSAPPEQVDLEPDQVLVEIDRFAFTANNVTYAVAGDMMNYWDFFPAEEGFGRVPVWGFGNVVRSRNAGLEEGERIYGYFPMSTHVVLNAGSVTAHGFRDVAPHRAKLAAVYNQYTRTAADPEYDAKYEDATMLFRPLFTTAFLLQDLLEDEDFFGARAVVLSSASSKTAFSLAFLLSRNPESRVEVIGLTSQPNSAFVESLGCYDRVVSYDEIAALPADLPIVYVDMAGSAPVRSTVHHHFKENVEYSCGVGITHWEQFGGGEALPGAKPSMFFAPSRVEKRTGDWGAAGFQTRLADAWRPFLAASEGWMDIVHGRGTKAVEQVYLETLEGNAKPDQGHVLSLSDDA